MQTNKTILYNTEMTRATQDDRKTQTRRIIKNIPEGYTFQSIQGFEKLAACFYNEEKEDAIWIPLKYQPRDILWVREPAKVIDYSPGLFATCVYLSDNLEKSIRIPDRFIDFYKEGSQFIKIYQAAPKWIKNCQGIPNGCIKELARTFLKVTNVRVERLQDITTTDIIKEGYPNWIVIPDNGRSALNESRNSDIDKGALEWWINLWNKTAPKGYKWEDNPDVFVNEYRRIKE